MRRFGAACASMGAIALVVLIGKSGLEAYWIPATYVWMPHNVYLGTAMALFFGGTVALCAAKSRMMSWLTSPALVQIGKLSYGIYLYHIFMFFAVTAVAAKLHLASLRANAPGQLLVNLLSLAATYGLALLSWRFIEGPANRLKARFPQYLQQPATL
jgi:peptidoglycan/LPS O-acetylase OafA/YrhL